MKVYCLPEFKEECDKLLKNNSYLDLNKEIAKFFHGRKFEDCLTGTNLNQSADAPHIKKDIGGRGGYRLYYVALRKKEEIYFGFVHPKTGSKGSSNTQDDFRLTIPKKIYKAIEQKELLQITITEGDISYTKPK